MTITAKIICDSLSPQGVRLTTFELVYPRIIHAEVMTHRVFSRNAASSRAIPVDRSIDFAEDFYSPVVWGKNKPGMSSDDVLSRDAQNACTYWWQAAVMACKDFAKRMSDEGLHKQWSNRPLEWFSNIKVIVTATEYDNFFWLRDDAEAAQPEIVELARKMKQAMDASEPSELWPGEWHVPYVETVRLTDYGQISFCYFVGDQQVSEDVAKKISASCCAQVSYRNLNTSVEKALEIFSRLFDGPKPHLSPVEHIATPMERHKLSESRRDVNDPYYPTSWEQGVTHSDRDGQLWSGNLKGFIQWRQVI